LLNWKDETVVLAGFSFSRQLLKDFVIFMWLLGTHSIFC